MEPYKEFECQMQSGWLDLRLKVIGITSKNETVMVICHKDGPIYITKEQVMEFFNLKEVR